MAQRRARAPVQLVALHEACRFLVAEGFGEAARTLAERFTRGPDQCPGCYVRHAATAETPECQWCRSSCVHIDVDMDGTRP